MTPALFSQIRYMHRREILGDIYATVSQFNSMERRVSDIVDSYGTDDETASLAATVPTLPKLQDKIRFNKVFEELGRDSWTHSDRRQSVSDEVLLEGELWLSVSKSNPKLRRWVTLQGNRLSISKSFKDRTQVFTLALDSKSVIQPTKKLERGLSIFHLDQDIGMPILLTLHAQQEAVINNWFYHLHCACLDSRDTETPARCHSHLNANAP
ncbi:hypothetical protein HDU91_003867, partial [Kappamyces sp. JEL0680]